MLRYCKRCRNGPFLKDNGCNAVKCAKCQFKQCFICGKHVLAYEEHFGTGKCPLFDDTEARLGREAARAEDRTIAQLLGEAVLNDVGDELGAPIEPFDFQEERPLDLERRIAPTPRGPDPVFIVVRVIQLTIILVVLGLTIALLRTRPPQGTDRSLFVVILFTTALSLVNHMLSYAGMPMLTFITIYFYLGEGIAFAVKLGNPHGCGNLGYISNNHLIAGSQVRCGLAKADTVFLWLGKRRIIHFSPE